ncbi:TetR family transcriptional regulator [Anaerocolumna sedimenticola]|uniref:TetR family transcriptional regulator n=1 Tax=Anaerocolumna sedimenticola TaxID=2696063 RepID=A0A6P1TP02_9FIRM|nr:TetR/AcrR family transcriptional regulator [Anaerocolumna sedimenticola]QHQ61355.1 TetR family transcriptional regulator [Anaerocolumna sedimenticola]
MNGYEKRTNAKKEAIINAAGELFTNRGITDVGISEIAAKANVSQVSIYNYFGDKNALAKEVLIKYLDHIIEGYDEILQKEIPFSEKLKIIMEKKVEAVNAYGKSLFSKFAWNDKNFQQIYKEAINNKAITIYTKFIEQGKKEGAIVKEIPDDVILDFLLSCVSFMQQTNYIKTDPKYKMGILRLCLYGLLGKEE